MALVVPLTEVRATRTKLTGLGLKMMEGPINFGADASADVFERLHAAAMRRDPDAIVLNRVLASDLAEAIDLLIPVVDGKRQLSRDYDAVSVTCQPSQGNTPTMVLAAIELDAWKFLPNAKVIDDIRAIEIFNAIKHLDYVSRFEPVNIGESLQLAM